MRVSNDHPDRTIEVRLNGQIMRDVVSADDQTGEVVRFRRDAESRLIVNQALQCVETETLCGVVTIGRNA